MTCGGTPGGHTSVFFLPSVLFPNTDGTYTEENVYLMLTNLQLAMVKEIFSELSTNMYVVVVIVF